MPRRWAIDPGVLHTTASEELAGFTGELYEVLRALQARLEGATSVVPSAAQARARALHLSLEPLSLQQLLVHAASLSAEENVSA